MSSASHTCKPPPPHYWGEHRAEAKRWVGSDKVKAKASQPAPLSPPQAPHPAGSRETNGPATRAREVEEACGAILARGTRAAGGRLLRVGGRGEEYRVGGEEVMSWAGGDEPRDLSGLGVRFVVRLRGTWWCGSEVPATRKALAVRNLKGTSGSWSSMQLQQADVAGML